MEFAEVVTTTPATREFTDEPLPDEVLHRLLDQARFAPSGGNAQGWRVIVVRDPARRRALAELCQPTWNAYIAQVEAGERPFTTVAPTSVDLAAAELDHRPNALLDGLVDAPAVLVVSVDLGAVASMDAELARVGVVSGASIYPFCHNLLLGARDAGYGGVMTTFLARREDEVRDLFGLPPSHAVAAMIVLGRPRTVITRLRRAPVEDFATVDDHAGPPFTG